MDFFGKKYELPTKCVTETAGLSIIQAAEAKADEKLLCELKDVDFIAREVHYHNHCRKEYTRHPDRRPHAAPESESLAQQKAHKEAFELLKNYVQESIIVGGNVERMAMLHERYLLFMTEHSPQFYNENYKTDKLKEKLKKHFGNRISFWQPNYRSELVYSSWIQPGQAVEAAFEAASSEMRRIQEAAIILRRHVQQTYENSPTMPWPPSAEFLASDETKAPNLLCEFLSYVTSGKPLNVANDKVKRTVNSYAQDLCYSITNGKWKMSKHLSLGMTIRHLTGSAELVTLLNRYGHCVSYSHLLELETAMCNKIKCNDQLLPSNISTTGNIVSHLCWDNFDLNEETPSGSGTTHSTHGIMIQERRTDMQTLISGTDVPRTKQRSVKFLERDLQPCFIQKHPEPNIDATITSCVNRAAVNNATQSDFFWSLCRATFNKTSQVPGWSGWVSKTSNIEGEQKLSTVGYMTPITSPITEYSTIQEILTQSQKATEKTGQVHTFITLDLAAAIKAYAVQWHSNKYQDIVINIGVFHTICSYFGCLGKLMAGSGFEDVLVESGICASGSIAKVMSGKHYNRAMRVHKIMMEALQRQLIKVFMTMNPDKNPDAEGMKAIENLAENPSYSNLTSVNDNLSCETFYSDYQTFLIEVREGTLGKTAQFWIGYMDKVSLILRFQRATKENNFDLHLACLEDMIPLFFACDHHNYARYLVVHILTLLNLQRTHPGAEELLRNNGFSVCRSQVPSSRNSVDITIEQTINRYAKCTGGIVGYSRNFWAYARWCITRHERAKYVELSFERASMLHTSDASHHDLQPGEMKRSEQSVLKVIEAIELYINPFDVDNKDTLFCLSSGRPVPESVEEHLLNVDSLGKAAYNTFLQDRFILKNKKFHEPLKRQKLQTFKSIQEKIIVTSSQNRLVEIRAERNIFGRALLLSQEREISLEMLLSYPLGPVPWALATADGCPTKTDKAKLLHALEIKGVVDDPPKVEECIYMIDGMAYFQALISIPETFGELAEIVLSRFPKCKRIDFVADTYSDVSIKNIERLRRGCGETFLIKGPKTKIPRDWKKFLSNGKNKEQLVNILHNEWKQDKYAHYFHGTSIYLSHNDQCTLFASEDGSTVKYTIQEELCSSQEEADTKIILHCFHASQSCQDNLPIRIRSPDTDIFMLLLRYANEIKNVLLFDTGTGNKRRVINVTFISRDLGVAMSHAMLNMHALSGCDTTSSFVRRGKLSVKSKLEKFPKFVPILRSLGSSLTITDMLLTGLEEFVCCMYSNQEYTDINKLRYDLFTQKYSPTMTFAQPNTQGVDLSLLPPCKASLENHISRVNYQCYIWNNAHIAKPITPTPVEHGWKLENGQLKFDWIKGDPLPHELTDVMESFNPDEFEDEDEPELVNLADILNEDEEEDC